MRKIIDVIDQILKEVPESESEFLEGLNRLVEDISWRAPEADYLSWEQLSDLLRLYIRQADIDPRDEQSWRVNILSIYSGMPAETIRQRLADDQKECLDRDSR